MTQLPVARPIYLLVLLGSILAAPNALRAQALGDPDHGQPGDEMIQNYLRQETDKISARFADDIVSLADWQAKRPEYVEQYYYMLGLSPRPEKTPLEPTVTGRLQEDGYTVDLLHYQSRPHLYVTGNLYRPAHVEAGAKLPAILYVCGHSHRGRDGNKVAYMSHGIWLARHGYICMIVDSLELGEIASFHHGTYNLDRWWWQSRGYTPAGVEAWNGVRGIDYLCSRPDVDPQRIGVTGISGGGAATYWVAAADPRVQAAVPVSGMADLESYVSNRVINRHCDCMFLYNTFQWPWTCESPGSSPRIRCTVHQQRPRRDLSDGRERPGHLPLETPLQPVWSERSGERDASASAATAIVQNIRRASFRFSTRSSRTTRGRSPTAKSTS